MGKINKFWISLDIILLIILIIFNVFFFSLGSCNVSTWISYAFVHFAFFMVLITPLLIGKRKNPPIFGFALYSALSAVYFLLALAAAVIFMIASLEFDNNEQVTGLLIYFISPLYIAAGMFAISIFKSVTTALVVHLVIAGLYAILLIINVIANEHTSEALEKRQEQIDYIKIASVKLKLLLDRVSDRETKRKVESVYDAISSSPVLSNIDLMDLENQILRSINELDDVISAGNKKDIISLSNTLLSAINERNVRLRLLN